MLPSEDINMVPQLPNEIFMTIIMKIKGSRVLESTLTKSQQPNLMLITHIFEVLTYKS